MTNPNSIAPSKLAKPYPEYPLTPHPTGRWCKKIRGKLHYFGKIADGPKAALEAYDAVKHDLHAGKRPREETQDGTTIKDLCNDFWAAKKALVDSGELSPVTFLFYERTTDLLVSHFGRGRAVADLGPDDFVELRAKLARKRDAKKREGLGPVALGNEIQRIRSVFKFALDNGLIEKPLRFGQNFKRPSAKTKRLEKATRGKQLFTAAEIRAMLDGAGIPLKAMILAGINCALGNSDIANLRFSRLDLEKGWLDYPRPKTGVERRCPLWAETIVALKEAIVHRPEPKREDDAALVFITKRGLSWGKASSDNPVSKEMAKLLVSLKLNGHRGFYTLRHTFQTVADESKDFVATRYIMGHTDNSMSGVYREDVSTERLQAVVDHVRVWLFKKEETK